MIRKKRLLLILVAVLAVFTMMPIAAGKVFAIDADTAPPEIDASSLQVTLPEGKTEVTAGDSVTVSVKASDPSGVGYVHIIYNYPGSTREHRLYTTYNPDTEAYEATFQITEDVSSGVCKIAYINAEDGKDNFVSLYNSDVVDTLYPDMPASIFPSKADLSVGNFTVYGTNADVTPPEIDASSLRVTLPEGKTEVTAGDSVTVSVKASDTSGVGYVHIIYNYPGSTREHRLYTTYNPDTEAYEGTFQITEDVSSGVCKIAYINAEDGKDNFVSLYNIDVIDTLYPDMPASFFPSKANLSAGDFTVAQRYKITFDTRGGSSIDPQIVISGQKATEPEKPVKEGRKFRAWYSDKNLTELWRFEKPVTEDITLYAGWIIDAGIGVYDNSNPGNYRCGTIDIAFASDEYNYKDATMMNYTLPEGPVTFKAKPAEGYIFKGWYEGVFGESHFIETPSENLVSDQNPYTPDNVDEAKALCAVFDICPGHTWEQKIQKATPEADGRIYQACSLCGTEETIAPLLKVSNIKLAGTSYTYTGKAIKPNVTVANAGEELSAEVYDVTYSNNTNVGTATVKVTLKGEYYEGTRNLKFKINKAANPLKIKAKIRTVKYSKLKKKTQMLAVTKVIKFTKKINDKKTYTLLSAKKGKKSFKKYFKINKTNGKVKVKKGLKKGAYKVKVKVKALGNRNYKASGWKTVTFTVRVK